MVLGLGIDAAVAIGRLHLVQVALYGASPWVAFQLKAQYGDPAACRVFACDAAVASGRSLRYSSDALLGRKIDEITGAHDGA